MNTPKAAKRHLLPNVVAFRRRAKDGTQKGATKFRGKFSREGRVYLTPLRHTEREAHNDVHRRIEEVDAAGGTASITLGVALEMVREDSELRGASAITQEGYARVAKFLLKLWDANTPLQEMSVGLVKEFVRRARDTGYPSGRWGTKHTCRGVNSLLEKDLPHLHRCFRLAKLESPIPEVKSWLGNVKRPVAKMFSSYADALNAIERVRSEEIQWNPRTVQIPDLSGRGWDADLLTLVWLTGARTGEVGRLRVENFILTPGQESVSLDSHKSEDRELSVSGSKADAIHRLVAAAQPNGYIVHGTADAQRMGNVTRVCRRWQPRLKEPRLTMRALRHSWCTFAQEYGIAQSVMMAGMGHTNPATTGGYTHSRPLAHRASFEAFVGAAVAELGSSK